MSGHASKVVEVIGRSDQRIEDAIRAAVSGADNRLENLEWFEVTERRGEAVGGAAARRAVWSCAWASDPRAVLKPVVQKTSR